MNFLSKFSSLGQNYEITIVLAFQPDQTLVLTIFIKDRKDPERILTPLQYSGSVAEIEARIAESLEADLKIYPVVSADITALTEKKAKLEQENTSLEAKIKANKEKQGAGVAKTTASASKGKKAKAKAAATTPTVTKELAPAPKSPDGISPPPTASQQPDLFASAPSTVNAS